VKREVSEERENVVVVMRAVVERECVG